MPGFMWGCPQGLTRDTLQIFCITLEYGEECACREAEVCVQCCRLNTPTTTLIGVNSENVQQAVVLSLASPVPNSDEKVLHDI